MKKSNLIRRVYRIPDYEHRGDLTWAENALRSACPEITIIESWEERDSEAEWDYKDEYGEEDFEPIYQGYVTFDIPQEKVHVLEEKGFDV